LKEIHDESLNVATLQQRFDDRNEKGNERYAELRAILASIGGKIDALSAMGSSVAVLQAQAVTSQRQLDDVSHRIDDVQRGAPHPSPPR
jgi:hypothetical protein